MKTTVIIGILLISLVQIAQLDAWLFRRIRIRLPKPKDICKRACPRVCPAIINNQAVCTFGCRALCGRKRRDAVDGNYHVTPLPVNIDFYDLNEDNVLEVVEIARTLGHDPTEINLAIAFNETDSNGDGKLTEYEFLQSKVFVFGKESETSECETDTRNLEIANREGE